MYMLLKSLVNYIVRLHISSRKVAIIFVANIMALDLYFNILMTFT